MAQGSQHWNHISDFGILLGIILLSFSDLLVEFVLSLFLHRSFCDFDEILVTFMVFMADCGILWGIILLSFSDLGVEFFLAWLLHRLLIASGMDFDNIYGILGILLVPFFGRLVL